MRKNKRGQVSLELGLSFICVFLILLGGIRLCAWAIGRMVQRQEDYEASDTYGRIPATEGQIGVEVDESNYNKLDLIK